MDLLRNHLGFCEDNMKKQEGCCVWDWTWMRFCTRDIFIVASIYFQEDFIAFDLPSFTMLKGTAKRSIIKVILVQSALILTGTLLLHLFLCAMSLSVCECGWVNTLHLCVKALWKNYTAAGELCWVQFFLWFYDKDTQTHSSTLVSSDKKPNVYLMDITDFKWLHT